MSGGTILIVEDNPKNAKLLRDVLTAKGYQTFETTTAEEGLDFARANMPALVLMDIHLPGMDGVTALRKLKADAATSGIPVIAVTASAMPSDRHKIESAGFDGYITKPISVKDFVEEVRNAIGDPSPKG